MAQTCWYDTPYTLASWLSGKPAAWSCLMSSAFCAVKTEFPGIDPGLNDVLVGGRFFTN